MNFELLQKLPERLQENYTKYCMSVELDIDLNRVILSEENKEKIDDFLIETKYKEQFMKHGLKPINKLIFYGASGTGKTYLSKALANYFKYEMLYVDIANALGQHKASSAIEAIFDLANHIGEAIIFLDECDAICWARDDKDNNSEDDIRRANNALFQHLDQMNPRCVFISATNLFDNLDTAFVNRFNVRCRFERPDVENLDEDFKRIILPGFTLEEDFEEDIKEILHFQARTFTQLSYRAMTDWVERAEKKAIINETEIVKESDIYGFLMQAMNIHVGYKNDKPYLYKE